MHVEHDAQERDGFVGELEITPVSAAIARHLNIDLSQEGRSARTRRGIALIVHGAPMSGNEHTKPFTSSYYFFLLSQFFSCQFNVAVTRTQST